MEHWREAYRLLAQRVEEGSLPPAYFESARMVLAHSNRYGVAKELRNDADAMLNAYIKRNGSYQFMTFVRGMLDHASDRADTISWILDLSRGPNMGGLLGELTESQLLTDKEKDPLYQERIRRERNQLASAQGEEAAQDREQLLAAIIAYAQYLNQDNRWEDAWKTLDEIEPLNQRPAELVLRLAALTGRLDALLSAYQSHNQDPPQPEQFLAVAAALISQGHNELAIKLEDYEYGRELQTETPSAAAYFGLANVRFEQKRTDEGLGLLRDVTLSVGEPFRNLPEAVRLLEQEHLKSNAAEYARQWRTAEPWNARAQLAAARLTSNAAELNTLRAANQADYSVRAQAATALRELNLPENGPTELDLLTHASISLQEVTQPFFVLSRLRAASLATAPADKLKLYSEAVSLAPLIHNERLPLAEVAFQLRFDDLGLASWRSYQALEPGGILGKAYELEADDYRETLGERLGVEELAAAVLVQRHEPDLALPLYNAILNQSPDPATRARIDKLKLVAERQTALIALNRRRQPKINQELVQPGVVARRYTQLQANSDLLTSDPGDEQ